MPARMPKIGHSYREMELTLVKGSARCVFACVHRSHYATVASLWSSGPFTTTYAREEPLI